MRASRAVPVASVAWLLTAAATLVAIALSFRADVQLPGAFLDYGPAAVAGSSALQLSFTSVGLLLATRRPGNPIGWLLLLVGVGYALSLAGIMVATITSSSPDYTVGAALAVWIAGAAWEASSVAMITVGFLFPTGRPQSRPWARALATLLGAWIVLYAAALAQPGPLLLSSASQNPFGFGPDLAVPFGTRSFPLVLSWNGVLTVAVGVAMVTRYRDADAVQRVQLRWPMLAVAVTMAVVAVVIVAGIVLRTDGPLIGESWVFAVIAVAAAFVPIAIGIAILRYRLYDIDRLIGRTIAYAAVTAALAGVYVVAVLAIGALLGSFAQDETAAVAASTLLVVALFGPLRRRAQTIVDRRFDRSRFDAASTLQAMAERLRNEADPDRVEARFSPSSKPPSTPPARASGCANAPRGRIPEAPSDQAGRLPGIWRRDRGVTRGLRGRSAVSSSGPRGFGARRAQAPTRAGGAIGSTEPHRPRLRAGPAGSHESAARPARRPGARRRRPASPRRRSRSGPRRRRRGPPRPAAHLQLRRRAPGRRARGRTQRGADARGDPSVAGAPRSSGRTGSSRRTGREAAARARRIRQRAWHRGRSRCQRQDFATSG
jgi:hypothetical protein